MKTLNINILILFATINIALAQTNTPIKKSDSQSFFDADSTAKPSTNLNVEISKMGLKNEDNILPKWAIDATYKYGDLKNNITMNQMAYSESISNSIPNKINTTQGNMNTINMQLCYFFGKKNKYHLSTGNRRFGISTGINYIVQSGAQIVVDKLFLQYKSTDLNNDVFRQIITSQGAVTEDIKTTNINIPLMLKFKHQFNDKSKYFSKIGYTVDAGLLLGIKNTNTYNANAILDYEAIYKYTNGIAMYDNTFNAAAGIWAENTSQIIRKDFWLLNHTSDDGVNAYFNRKHDEGLNVALDKKIATSGTTSYNITPSYGFLLQPSLSYYLGYKVTFLLGGYFSYQQYKNATSSTYMITNKVGEYNSIINGINQNVVTSKGLNIGLRIFFGEQKDIDYDGVPDNVDNCKLLYGKENHGCPDSDGDKVTDDIDQCKDVAGSRETDGCPDQDGDLVKDEEDACPSEPGVQSGDPKYNGCPLEKIVEDKAKENGYVKIDTTSAPKPMEEYYDVLQKDYLNFDFGKADLLNSNLMILDNAVNILNKNPNLIIFISGHTDSIGSPQKNMQLSLERANKVGRYLIEKGINEDRILEIGYGNKKPLTNNKDENSRALNRRTELKLLSPIKKKN